MPDDKPSGIHAIEQDELRVVDIALLPGHRNAGVGSTLLQRIFGEAEATKKPLRLKVLKGNRAARFYHRLGFVNIGETEMHFEMEWRPPAPAPEQKNRCGCPETSAPI